MIAYPTRQPPTPAPGFTALYGLPSGFCERDEGHMELSPRLMAAFDRLAKGPPPIPNWPRCVRIGVDYPVQVTANDIETDQQADAFAYACYVLGNLRARDPKGDPGADCTAQAQAEKAGPDYSRAYHLLMAIRDATDEWAARGRPDAPALPDATLRILQRAARGERVADAGKLALVLDAAEQLSVRLSRPLLSPVG
jgi:hypothetical protein